MQKLNEIEKNDEFIISYDITNKYIEELKIEYGKLKIENIKDKKGYDLVRKSRMKIVKLRSGIENKRKELKEGILKRGRLIDGEARRISDELKEIEYELRVKQNVIDKEKEKIKEEKEKKEALKLQFRVDALLKYGQQTDIETLKKIDNEQFNDMLESARLFYEEEQEEKEKKEAEARAEKERLERQRIEQEKITALQKEAQRKIDEANAKIEAEKKAIEDVKQKAIDEANRAKEIEKAKNEAVKQAKIEAEEKAKREKEIAELKAARQPDKKKLKNYSIYLQSNPLLDLKTEEANNLYCEIKQQIEGIVCYFEDALKKL